MRHMAIVTATILAAAVGGCTVPQVSPLLTGAAKVVGGQMAALTTAEVQALAQTGAGVVLTDEQAALAVEVLATLGLNSVQDVQDLIEQIEQGNDPGLSEEQIAALIAAFSDFDMSQLPAPPGS